MFPVSVNPSPLSSFRLWLVWPCKFSVKVFFGQTLYFSSNGVSVNIADFVFILSLVVRDLGRVFGFGCTILGENVRGNSTRSRGCSERKKAE